MMKVIKLGKLSSEESCLSSDESCQVMKVKEVEIAKK